MADLGRLDQLAGTLDRALSPANLARIRARLADDAADAIERAAGADLGGDRRFRNMRGGGRLGVRRSGGAGGAVQLALVPAGLWGLAQHGRRGRSPIRPRRGRAVLTPAGPRARSTSAPSRGLGTADEALTAAGRKLADVAGPVARDVIMGEL